MPSEIKKRTIFIISELNIATNMQAEKHRKAEDMQFKIAAGRINGGLLRSKTGSMIYEMAPKRQFHYDTFTDTKGMLNPIHVFGSGHKPGKTKFAIDLKNLPLGCQWHRLTPHSFFTFLANRYKKARLMRQA